MLDSCDAIRIPISRAFIVCLFGWWSRIDLILPKSLEIGPIRELNSLTNWQAVLIKTPHSLWAVKFYLSIDSSLRYFLCGLEFSFTNWSCMEWGLAAPIYSAVEGWTAIDSYLFHSRRYLPSAISVSCRSRSTTAWVGRFCRWRRTLSFWAPSGEIIFFEWCCLLHMRRYFPCRIKEYSLYLQRSLAPRSSAAYVIWD